MRVALLLGSAAFFAFAAFRWLFAPPEPHWDSETNDPDTLSGSWLRNRLPIHEARTIGELHSRVERKSTKSLLQ
jgi:hypothetical protein